MSAIHVRTLVEALDSPGTLVELAERTGYSPRMIFATIVEARGTGHFIQCLDRHGEPTAFVLTNVFAPGSSPQ